LNWSDAIDVLDLLWRLVFANWNANDITTPIPSKNAIGSQAQSRDRRKVPGWSFIFDAELISQRNTATTAPIQRIEILNAIEGYSIKCIS
jgi:hypothetical protein